MEIQSASIERAFRMFYYGGQYESALEAFIARWGEPNTLTLHHVLAQGNQDEKVLAILMLGYSPQPDAQEMVIPFLQSSDPLERWASALSLGSQQDERAMPVLLTLFDEFLPPRMHPLEREGGRYHFWRMNVAALLGEWNKPAFASVLRAALEKSWRFEQADTSDRKQVWFPYQDELVYALGQLRVFGALTGFSLPTARLHLWFVLLACGAIQVRDHYGDLLTAVQINTTLQEEIMRVLAQHFGLSVSEQKECIERFADLYFARMEW